MFVDSPPFLRSASHASMQMAHIAQYTICASVCVCESGNGCVDLYAVMKIICIALKFKFITLTEHYVWMCELWDCVLAYGTDRNDIVLFQPHTAHLFHPTQSLVPVSICCTFYEPNSTFACIIFNYKCAHFVDYTTQACGVDTSTAPSASSQIYFDPEPSNFIKIVDSIRFRCKFSSSTCHNIDGRMASMKIRMQTSIPQRHPTI